jgi:ABC-type Fe3+-citrate transport system substrate-binding protein
MDMTLEEKFKKIAEFTAKSLEMEKRMEERDRRVDAEIRQLRIETRRMLERWLGEPFTDDPDLDDDETE